MKIGVMIQGFVRPDSTPQQRVAEVVAEAVATEEAGLASFGVSEQHFKFPTNSTGPIDAIMAAIAQATSRIELVPSAVILPLHHPINVAERWAAVDIISGGRLRFGVGKGNAPLTFDAYGIDANEAHDRSIEALELIIRAWTQEKFDFDGKFWQLPEVGLCPRPLQTPHPRLGWTGVTDQSAQTAGSLQLPYMTGAAANTWEEVENVIEKYHTAFKSGTPIPGAVGEERVSVLVNGHIGADFDSVAEQVAYGVVPYINRVVTHRRELLARAGRPDPTFGEQFLDNFAATAELTPCVFGSPDDCLPVLKRFEQLGVDEVDVIFDYAEHDEIVRSIGMLGELAREVAAR
ncbi:LLM class flavin-dependent oxidoreductase [Amycolatopsis jejuensis]|uniref:LLM class flavin-dependent oxidoreductase n=1 Tax=Amycolatopsis jejuensis TaxID=330084 RepID=UPI000524C821|nr:LLM class flavin-dependent oxidoreductase [Amycolatopsis jejuensis]